MTSQLRTFPHGRAGMYAQGAVSAVHKAHAHIASRSLRVVLTICPSSFAVNATGGISQDRLVSPGNSPSLSQSYSRALGQCGRTCRGNEPIGISDSPPTGIVHFGVNPYHAADQRKGYSKNDWCSGRYRVFPTLW